MNNRTLYALLGVVALVIVGFLVYNQSRESNTLESTNQAVNTNASASSNTNTTTPTNTNTASNNNTNGQFSDESDLDQGKVYEIAYDGSKFSPATISIKAGDTVVFKNNGTKNFWPASGPHPQHTNYPEFDPKKAIPEGESFQFKFLKVGEWGFHDHLNASAFGKITVTQ